MRIATILGTLQSTLTDFRYLRNVWKRNTEEERLLGVSLTGIMDHGYLSGEVTKAEHMGHYKGFGGKGLPAVLQELREVAVETNREWASKLGIPQSTAITCVKPSGTVSQLVDSASGIHPRYSQYYIRRVRADARDPLCKVLIDSGVPHEEAIGSPSTLVFSFPQKAPEGAVTAGCMGAMEQVELWKIYQDHWCEHKPSMTCYYKDSEFLEVGQWVYNHFDEISGVSFLPYDDHVYKQAPYEPITEEQYNELVSTMPTEIVWDIQEHEDNTVGSQTLACTGNSCEL